jgi:hypothetical protein
MGLTVNKQTMPKPYVPKIQLDFAISAGFPSERTT